jgi:hypothetical protein
MWSSFPIDQESRLSLDVQSHCGSRTNACDITIAQPIPRPEKARGMLHLNGGGCVYRTCQGPADLHTNLRGPKGLCYTFYL